MTRYEVVTTDIKGKELPKPTKSDFYVGQKVFYDYNIYRVVTIRENSIGLEHIECNDKYVNLTVDDYGEVLPILKPFKSLTKEINHFDFHQSTNEAIVSGNFNEDGFSIKKAGYVNLREYNAWSRKTIFDFVKLRYFTAQGKSSNEIQHVIKKD